MLLAGIHSRAAVIPGFPPSRMSVNQGGADLSPWHPMSRPGGLQYPGSEKLSPVL